MRILVALICLLASVPVVTAQEIPPAAGEEAIEDAPLTATLYPPPLQTKERLRRLILEFWCAQRRGADDETLMRLYLKHSFPSLQDWHKVWNRALEDKAWVRAVYDEVRVACPGPADNPSATEAPK